MAKIVLIVLMCVVFESNGHLLKNILSDVHDRVHGIAGSVLGGLNIHGHVNGHLHHHNPPPPPPEQETVIVVVEDGDNGGNYGPGPGQNPHGNYNNQNGPHHMRPGYGHHGQWQGNNEGNQHHHNPHHHDHHGNNNPGYNNPGYNPGYNNHGNNNPGYNHHGNENPGYNNQGHNNPGYNNHGNNNPEYNNQGNNNPGYNNGGQNNYNQQPSTPGYQNNQNNYTPNPNQENKPTYGTIHSEPTQSPPKFGTTTKEEEPLYVPLKPNEYNYGGEKIDINPPKRETGTDSESESPADENIDIRLGNK